MTKIKKLFNGRLNRTGYFLRNIISLAVFYFLLLLNPYLYTSIPGYFYLITTVAFVYITSLVIRRLRDIGLPIWLFLVVLFFAVIVRLPIAQGKLIVQVINLLIGLSLFIYPGQKEANSRN